MSESDAELSPFRRFPWAPALLCAVSLAAAAWTWMRYSYAWPVGLRDLGADPASPGRLWLRDRYVTFSGQPRFPGLIHRPMSPSSWSAGGFWVWIPGDPAGKTSKGTYIACTGTMPDLGARKLVALRGRVWIQGFPPGLGGEKRELICVDCAASRLTGASVAGLVVGAMGTFVFALHLARWLEERRATVAAGCEKGTA